MSDFTGPQKPALLAVLNAKEWKVYWGLENEKVAQDILATTMRVDPRLCSIVVINMEDDDVLFAKLMGFKEAKKGWVIFRSIIEEAS